MEYSKDQSQPQNPKTPTLSDRIGNSLHRDFRSGFVSKYSIILGTSIGEENDEGLVYDKHAEIIINGAYLKVLPPEEGTNIDFSIGLGEVQKLMRMVFVVEGSPVPSPHFNLKKDFVSLFYPMSILPMYLSALDNAKSLSLLIFPDAPGKSFLQIEGDLEVPEVIKNQMT